MSKTNVFFLGASLALMFPVLHAQAVVEAKAPATAHAATSPATAGLAPADDAVAAQLVKLQTEVMLLKAQTAKAQAQAELKKAAAGDIGDGDDSKSDRSGRPVKASATPGSSQLPAVTSIYGRDKALVATLRLNSGGTLDARVGDTLPDGYRLARIDAGKVTFVRGGRQFVAGLSAPATLPSVAGGGALMLAPPLPGRD